jgi:hypothetical protein
MELLASPPKRNNELSLDENSQVFRNPLSGHVEVPTKLV